MSLEVLVQSCLAWLFWACGKQNSMAGCSSGRQILTRNRGIVPWLSGKIEGGRERGEEDEGGEKRENLGSPTCFLQSKGPFPLSWFCVENGEIPLQTLIKTGLMMLKMPPINQKTASAVVPKLFPQITDGAKIQHYKVRPEGLQLTSMSHLKPPRNSQNSEVVEVIVIQFCIILKGQKIWPFSQTQ